MRSFLASHFTLKRIHTKDRS